jgi:hypothetical protein
LRDIPAILANDYTELDYIVSKKYLNVHIVLSKTYPHGA